MAQHPATSLEGVAGDKGATRQLVHVELSGFSNAGPESYARMAQRCAGAGCRPHNHAIDEGTMMRARPGTIFGAKGFTGKSVAGVVLVGTGCLLASVLAIAAPGRGVNDPMATVRQKFTAFDRHDVVTIRTLYAQDAVLHSPDHPDLTGNVPIAGTYRSLFAFIPDARDVVTSLDVSGDKVFSQYVLTGHLQGVAGKPIKVPIMSVYTVRNNHIVLDDTYYDRKAE